MLFLYIRAIGVPLEMSEAPYNRSYKGLSPIQSFYSESDPALLANSSVSGEARLRGLALRLLGVKAVTVKPEWLHATRQNDFDLVRVGAGCLGNMEDDRSKPAHARHVCAGHNQDLESRGVVRVLDATHEPGIVCDSCKLKSLLLVELDATVERQEVGVRIFRAPLVDDAHRH